MRDVFPIQIYYEDTDHSGRVYHANYLKYFERAREHLLGVEELVRLYREEGVGFVVYKADLSFREGAQFGELLEVRSSVRIESDYRATFRQEIWRPDGRLPMVEGIIQLVTVNRDHQLIRLPEHVRRLGQGGG